jgi:hypothetical protein
MIANWCTPDLRLLEEVADLLPHRLFLHLQIPHQHPHHLAGMECQDQLLLG